MTPPETSATAGGWYCCKADFGEHEPTCKNFKLVPATAEMELREKIAIALQEACGSPLPYCRALADAILPLLASEIRRQNENTITKLGPYLSHLSDCKVPDRTVPLCSCGLRARLAELRKVL